MSRYRATLPVLGLGAALLGCGDVPELPPVGRELGAVTGGVPSPPAHDGVVDVYSPNNGCSGSLIAPNVVMTALHCVVVNSSATFTCDTDGTGGKLGDLLPASSLFILTGPGPDTTPRAVGKRLFSTGSMDACQWDLALIVLDQDVDAPLIPLRFGRATEPGEQTTVIGYGFTTNNRTVAGRQERDNVDVLYVGADFWHSASPFASSDTLVVGEGPCHGDSGAPLLSMETGAAIGVSSVGYSTCQGVGVQNAYTEVASFESTIREALAYAGHDPVLEQTGSGGDAGATGQGGEPGALGEGGAPTAMGGSSALGGTGGGSGGTHAGAPNGAAGKAADGAGASAGAAATSDGTDLDGGSGSRRDPACTCRTAGSYRDSRSLSALLALALGLGVRRRRSRRA